MHKTPHISVVLPTYNRARLVGRAIHSILNQTYSDFELIVVDDGSTDHTQSEIKKFSDSRLRYIYISHGGGAAARNAGIRMARGQFIAFQDSDDEWFLNKLEKQMDVFEKADSSIGVVYCGFYKYNKDGKKKYYPGEEIKTTDGMIHYQLLSGNFITTQSAIVRKDCFDKVGYFDVSLPGMQEWDLWIRISRSYKFAFVPKPLLTAYFTQESITAHKKERLRAKEIIFEKYRVEFLRYPDVFALHAYSIGHAMALTGDVSRSKHYLLDALRKKPWSVQIIISFILAIIGSKRLYRAVSNIPRHLSSRFIYDE